MPTAKAGPEGGFDVASGDSVTLGVDGAENGFDDPWGDNVEYEWTPPAGTTVTYTEGTTATSRRPVFTAPMADGTLIFTLTVTGNGGSFAATSTVDVRVVAAVIMPPMPESASVNGATLTLTYGEDLQATTWTSTPGSSPVYLAVLSEPGERRNIETAPGTMAQASGRTVTVTLDRRAGYNQEVTLSYFPDNAEAASRVRDLGGNEADGFAGLEVRNDTPQGPHVEGAAFAEAAKTYAIGDTIEVDVTFSESVRVSAAPTIGLAIGSATRKAVWKAGQAAGTVHRFAYTVAQGDLDTDGMAIRRNTLALGGGTIATVAKSGTVDLRHDSLPRHRDRTVDGVRPAVKAGADGAVALGPELVLTWTEELDPASVPAGSGGFTVKIGGTVEPAVRSVAIDGATVTLKLARGIRANTTGVTVDYAPQSATPIKDRAGNAAVAFTGRAVTARSADNNEATGTVTVSGLATVGQRLTATVSDIADPDGPPSTGYTVTWLRIDGSSETTIRTSTLATGVASNFYTLAALDAGKRIKVKVAFEDYIGNPEEFESAAFPGFGRIMWPAESACAMPSLEGRELVWTGQVGVGTSTVGGSDFSHGFGALNTGSTLSDKTFAIGGTDYTIDYLGVGAPGARHRRSPVLQHHHGPADVGDKRRAAPCLRRHVPLRGWPRLRHQPGCELHRRHLLHLQLVLLRPRLVGACDPAGVSEQGRHAGAGADGHRGGWRDAHHDLRREAEADGSGAYGRRNNIPLHSGRLWQQPVHALRRPRRGGAERQPGHHDPGPVRRGRADDRACLFRRTTPPPPARPRTSPATPPPGFKRSEPAGNRPERHARGPRGKERGLRRRRADLRHRRRHRRGRHLQRVRDRDRDLDREAPHCAGAARRPSGRSGRPAKAPAPCTASNTPSPRTIWTPTAWR